MYEPKPLFLERMQKLLTKKEDYDSYLKFLETEPKISIRVNTIKISPKELKKLLEKKGWEIEQPYKNHEEIFIINSKLKPGELGRSLEHQIGYYYVQETASMLPIIALQPQREELVLDLCGAPGSKTTQAAAKMENTGTIIGNDKTIDRIQILATNLERCGISNTIITKKEGEYLCQSLERNNFEFDKILIDAPCSGEGTFRSTKKGMLSWNINTVRKLSKIQKRLISAASKILKKDGILVYSTCTHAPEENEEIVDYALNELGLEIIETKLPVLSRPGITEWQEKKYDKRIKLCHRVYPQDNDSEGFFIAKLRKK